VRANLTIIDGPREGEIFEIGGDPVSIGREAGNAIVLRDASVSRRHCIIESRDGSVFISDLGSLNGTLINGAKSSGTALQNGDVVKIGDFTLRYSNGLPTDRESSIAIDETEFRLPANSLQIKIEDVFGAMARDLAAILKISETVISIRDPAKLEPALLDLIMEVVPADSGAIVIVDDRLEIVRSVVRDRRNPAADVTVSKTVVAQVLRDRRVLVIPDTSPVGSESLLGSRARSLIAVPIVVFDRPIAAIYLMSATISFEESHAGFLTAVAGIGGLALENANSWAALESENSRLRAEAFSKSMLGESDAMRRVFEVIRKVATVDSTVLIDGESGTGKELAAQSIHLNGKRRDMPFVAVNCAALTESLIESELFGHEKGAFTGAVSQKKGKIELASGGTLFLDEIGELNVGVQAKLLRVLQEREFERVGGTRPIRADIRLVAATNRDLQTEVKSGRFREDLFYRLNVVRLTMPALRERADDIPLLAEYFTAKYAAQMNRRLRGISAAAMRLLTKYDFPGNVRELENAIERAVVLGAGEWILPEDLPEDLVEGRRNGDEPASNYHDAILELKRKLIVEAVAKAKGSIVDAAKLLGVHPNYLHRLIRNLEIRSEIDG